MSLPGLPKSFRPKEEIEESEEETLVGLPASFRKSKKVSDKDKLKDIRQQVFKKGTAGALSAYGNLLDLIHAQTREKQTPGQEALTQAEFESPASDRKSTRLNSSHVRISYAVFCLKKKTKTTTK